MKKSKLITANSCRYIARFSLLTISIVVFVFALLSGSEDYGGGFMGVLKNSPNALPWLIVLILVYIAWKWELVGGITVTLFGMYLVYFFNFQGSNFYISTFIMTIFIVLMGVLFLLSWVLRKKTTVL